MGGWPRDGIVSDGTWDAPWLSATQQTDFGYTAEVSIPFAALQYTAGDDTTWGINFALSRRRTLERSYWSGPIDHWGRMSQAGDLVGLDVPPPARRHQVIPYALSQAREGSSLAASFGVDARYALTPQTSAYATLNPDFATIEADQEQINLTRFELNLTEKRQFFIEGQELFRQRNQDLLLPPDRGHLGGREGPRHAGGMEFRGTLRSGRPAWLARQRELHGCAGAA